MMPVILDVDNHALLAVDFTGLADLWFSVVHNFSLRPIVAQHALNRYPSSYALPDARSRSRRLSATILSALDLAP